MVVLRVVSAGGFAGIEKEPYNLHVTVLRGERMRAMPALAVCRGEQLTRVIEPPQPGRSNKVIDSRAPSCQRFGRAQISERESRRQRRSSPLTTAPFDRGA